MSDNRKYYYLKLKESYFDDDAIVLLESMQDGMLYSNILLKLYSCSSSGKPGVHRLSCELQDGKTVLQDEAQHRQSH